MALLRKYILNPLVGSGRLATYKNTCNMSSQSLFMADTARRVLVEFVIPLVGMLGRQRKVCVRRAIGCSKGKG